MIGIRAQVRCPCRECRCTRGERPQGNPERCPANDPADSVRTLASCPTCGAALYMTLAAMPQMFCRACSLAG